MNERIRLLAEQAGLRFTQLMSNPMVPVVDGKETDLEKFAELIVRECAQLILDKKMGDLGDNPGVKEWEEGYNEAVHDCYYLIRKHFGVEE
jgi:hypothetical protein